MAGEDRKTTSLPSRRRLFSALTAVLLLAGGFGARAQTPEAPPLRIQRIQGPIAVDGDLSDPGWRDAAEISDFYETNPGDNVRPAVATRAWVAYDDRYFYIAVRCDDPDPASIRAPYVDRDTVASDQDFCGIMLDTRGDGRAALEFFVNPRGIHDDGVINDANGNENFSPDLFWDSAARITETGWQAELRIPFSSLRYSGSSPVFRLLVYRNRPREFRYQYFSRPLPRGSNCLLCHAQQVMGLENLPTGSHWVAAPFLAARREWRPVGDPGTPLGRRTTGRDGGLDVKWLPNADHAVDFTLNPDFSQVESDTAHISVNRRFALFYPEKRPFFMEGVDLLDTPIDAVYTRTITNPRWGVRSTGKVAGTEYTVLAAEDQGGGSVILPGAQSSSFARQDFETTDVIARLRRSSGTSFWGLLFTGRENGGGSFNRVFGPDFQWRLGEQDTLAAQLLLSRSQTPDRPDLAAEWDGGDLQGHALYVKYVHETRSHYEALRLEDLSEGFRADAGFVPRVGYRRARLDTGWNFYPQEGFFSRVTPEIVLQTFWDRKGGILESHVWPGVYAQGKHSLFASLYANRDTERVGGVLLRRSQVYFEASLSPSPVLSRISGYGEVGGQFDYANVRVGRGAFLGTSATVRPGQHLTLQFNAERQWLNSERAGWRGRLFTAQTARLKAVYVLSSRTFLRAIVQFQDLRQNGDLYPYPVPARSGGLSSSLLFAYRLNWQTVFYAGAGDDQVFDPSGRRLNAGRQVFFKVSYAFSR
jgi:hypothetical protein